MSECEYYSNFERTDKSGETTQRQQQRQVLDHDFPCCISPDAIHNTVHKNNIGDVNGASTHLQCKGKIELCPLPKKPKV